LRIHSNGGWLAVVVPTLNDDAALAHFLPRLAQLASPPDEVIVVDGAASEATAAICAKSGCAWIATPPGRGLQLGAGAMAARAARAQAHILWFVHADCQPHPDAARAIRESVRNGASGGYFRFRFGGERNFMKRLLEWCIAWRCRVAMVYGDQGIFVTRAAYDASPGFSAQPLFEEVALVRALKRTGDFVALELPMIVSARRWERDGFLRRTLHNRVLALGFILGVRSNTLARWYRTRSPS
jgi:rSAM/selenodomain-associated transferase 2